MGQKLVLFVIVIIFFSSCKMSSRKDLSLSLEEYINQGMPDYSRNWTPKDYEDAWQALIRIKNKKPFSLPRKNSEKSGMIFERIVSPENFSFIEEDSLRLFEKAYIIKTYLFIQSELVDIYTDHYRKKQYYSSELIDMHNFGLVVTEKMLYLAHKINESDKKEDMAMKSAFPDIQKIYVNMLLDVLDKQKYASIYSNEDSERLCDSISFSIERNKSWMDSSALLDIKHNMQVVVDSTSSVYLRNKYLSLSEAL